MEKARRVFLQVVIDPEKKQKFVNKIEQEGKNITDVIMDFVDSYIDETEKVDVVELNKRLQTVEKFINIEKAQMLGESIA